MKKLLFLSLALILTSTVQAKTLHLALDSDPESLDPHVQLSGSIL